MSWRGRGVVRPDQVGLRLAQIEWGVWRAGGIDDPVPHGGVELIQPRAWRRQLGLDQLVDVNLAGASRAGCHDRPAVLQRGPDQIDGIHRVFRFRQVRGILRVGWHGCQGITVQVGVLHRVEYAPEAPHTADVVVADVAVVEEVSRRLLTAAGAALVLQVEAGAWADRLRVQPGALGVLRRELLERWGRGELLRFSVGVAPPAVRPTV